jgi:two-component system cell cycle response regulator CpdR
MARILVAEDEAPVREYVRRILESQGHEVVVVSDGAEALVKLARHPFDLLLTDISMPNMDGVELWLKVARDWPGMRVLMMSGYAAQRTRVHGIGEPSYPILQKPFSMVDLHDAVERVLASKQDA